MRAWWIVSFAVVAACSGGEPEPKKDDKKDAACDLSFDTIADKAFVRTTRGDSGKMEEDTLARLRFFKDGDKLKANYTARALLEVYSYICAVKGPELTCWQEKPSPEKFCDALVANGKTCTPEAVAELTGLKADDVKAAVERELAAIKAMSPKAASDMRNLYSSANAPLRGVLHARIKPKECQLSVSDMYQVMTNGQLREIENVTGTSTFAKTERAFVFEDCTDFQNMVVLSAPDAAGKPGESVMDVTVGQTVPVKYVGAESVKAEAGCTYSMDTFAAHEPVAQAVAVAPDASGNLTWAFQASFSKPGKSALHMYRYKTCGDKPQERFAVACQHVTVQ